SVFSTRHLLRLYAALSAAHRQALWEGGVLSVTQMTPAQRRLYLASLQERNRYRSRPLDLTQWAGGSFSLSAVRAVRVVQSNGTSVGTRSEPASLATGAAGASSPPAAVQQRVAGVTQSTPGSGAPASGVPSARGAPTAAATSITRVSVMQLTLRLQN